MTDEREPTEEIVAELAAIGVQWMEDVGGAPRSFWRNTDALEYSREIGALAQAARNFLISGDATSAETLDRLASDALGCEPVGRRGMNVPDCSRCHSPILGEPVRADHHDELWCSESCRDGDAEAAADLHARLAQR